MPRRIEVWLHTHSVPVRVMFVEQPVQTVAEVQLVQPTGQIEQVIPVG